MVKLKITMEKSSIATLGPQRIIVIQKNQHDLLKEFLNRKLKVTITLETLDD